MKSLSEGEAKSRTFVALDLIYLNKLYHAQAEEMTKEERDLLRYVCRDMKRYLEAEKGHLKDILGGTFGKPDFENPPAARIVGCFLNIHLKSKMTSLSVLTHKP
jgi:hypothetical protein